MMFAKIGPLMNRMTRFGRAILFDHFGAQDVGWHQVRA